MKILSIREKVLCKLDCVDNSTVTNSKLPVYLSPLTEMEHEHIKEKLLFFSAGKLGWNVQRVSGKRTGKTKTDISLFYGFGLFNSTFITVSDKRDASNVLLFCLVSSRTSI